MTFKRFRNMYILNGVSFVNNPRMMFGSEREEGRREERNYLRGKCVYMWKTADKI